MLYPKERKQSQNLSAIKEHKLYLFPKLVVVSSLLMVCIQYTAIAQQFNRPTCGPYASIITLLVKSLNI